MAKLIWNGYVDLASKIDPPVSFITGANLKKKPPKKEPEKKPSKK